MDGMANRLLAGWEGKADHGIDCHYHVTVVVVVGLTAGQERREAAEHTLIGESVSDGD